MDDRTHHLVTAADRAARARAELKPLDDHPELWRLAQELYVDLERLIPLDDANVA